MAKKFMNLLAATIRLRICCNLRASDPNPLNLLIEPLSDGAVVMADTDGESLSGTTL